MPTDNPPAIPILEELFNVRVELDGGGHADAYLPKKPAPEKAPSEQQPEGEE